MASSGNFTKWSPLFKGTPDASITAGGTRFDGSTNNTTALTDFAIPVGTKFYAEVLGKLGTNYYAIFGIAPPTISLTTYARNLANVYGIEQRTESSGYTINSISNTTVGSNSSSLGTFDGQVITYGIAVNRVDDELKLYWNNTLKYTLSIPSTGVFHFMACHTGGTSATSVHYNFNGGHDSTGAGDTSAGTATDENGFGEFQYSPPSGHLACSTANLPMESGIDPAQTDDDHPQKQFETVTYSGTQTAGTAISVGFKPDLIWTKIRVSSDSRLVDSSRGNTKFLISNNQNAESTSTTGVTSFTSTGYVLSTDQLYNGVSGGTPYTYVAWCWRANGGTTSTDSTGDITVTRQSNTSGGFAILSYSGNGSSDQTIAHGLGKTPAFVITKNRSSTSHWAVWHQSRTGYYGQIEDTGSWASDSSQFYTNGMTSNFIGVKGSGATNESGDNMIAYVWTEIDGFSKFGSYEGNGNSDGPFVYIGFRPRLLMIRNVEQSSNWGVYDSERQTFNPNENYLRWNTNGAESGTSNSNDVDFLSNGFKVRSTETDLNTNDKKFIYACWGDVPFKYNNAF